MDIKKRLLIGLLLVIGPLARAAAPLHKVPGAVKDRYIVLLSKDTPADAHAESLVRSANAKLVHVYAPLPATSLNGFSMLATQQAAQAMTHKPGVESVWEVPTVRVTGVQYGPPQGLDRIDQRDLPLNGSYSYSLFSTPTTIYIADTGVDPRADLGSRLVANINFVTDTSGVRDPNDYTDHGLPLNDRWHGTPSAVIAAGTNYGVAKFANIANVRVISGFFGVGTYDDVVAGVQWITQQAIARPAERHVANASFAGGPYEPSETAFRDGVAAGVGWVFAAGNIGPQDADACNNSPARLGPALSGAITVGAMRPTTDSVDPESSQGSCVEIFAPTLVEWGTATETDGTVAAGTSAAAPHVAGVFALRLAGSTGTNAEQEGVMKGAGTPDRLTNLATGSPNLLLYSLLPKRRSSG